LARFADHLGRDKLQCADPGEHATHADPDVIRVFAVVVHVLLDLDLIDALDGAGIDLPALPAVGKAAKTFTEAPGIASRVAKHRPDHLGILVFQRALGHLP